MSVFNGLPLWQQALRGIGIFLCRFIYWVISGTFQLFMTISRVDILSSETIQPIYQRVTMILTIIMTFYITFEFVKYVVQPEMITDKTKGVSNIPKKIIIVILLIAFVPKIFSVAYELQNKMIEKQFFSKIILGKKSLNFDTYGSEFSANMFSLFYKVDKDNCGSKCTKASYYVNYNLEKLRNEGTTDYLDDGINESEKITVNGDTKEVPIINFSGFMAIIVGCFVVYILILYCVDIGTRYVQLVFLQIIAPIAIIGYMSPKKDGMFQKWTKQCVTTYIDLFIRLAIIYFVLLLVNVIGDAYESDILFKGIGNVSPSLRLFTYIALIMGLLLFANKAPKMLNELLPSGGAAGIGFGLKGADRVAPMAARSIGLATGGVAGLKRGVVRSANAHKRRQDIKDKLKEEGKPYKNRDVRRALKSARREEKTAEKDYRKNRGEIGKAKNELNMAKSQLELARRSGKSESEIENLKNNVVAKQKQYDKMMGYKNAYNTAKDKLAEAESNSYGVSPIVQGVGAGLAGLVSGGLHGAGATKLGDVGKKVSEINKNIADKELARINWFEEGGGATLNASLRKTVTKIQKKFGIKTESDKIKLDVERMNKEVKENEAQAALYASVKSGVDSAEERSSSKVTSHEQKIKVTADSKGEGQLLSKLNLAQVGDTTSEVYAKYEAAESRAKSEANAAQAELTKYKETAAVECDRDADRMISQIGMKASDTMSQIDMNAIQELSKINGSADQKIEQLSPSLSDTERQNEIDKINHDRETESAVIEKVRDQQKELIKNQQQEQIDAINQQRRDKQAVISQKIVQLQEEVSEKYALAGTATANLQEALKTLKRYGVDQAIKGDVSDPVLVTKVNTMRQVIDNARSNSELANYVREVLVDNQDLIKEFETNSISSWDNYDKIQAILTNRSSVIKDENSMIKEAIRSINESAATAAANANNSATGSSKK